jgi:hypothetical protein
VIVLSWDDEPSGTPERSARVNADDKRVVNAKTDVNQLVPFKDKWAWDKYLAGCANHCRLIGLPQPLIIEKGWFAQYGASACPWGTR